jgi:uncharacterized membrane protein YphA (DoxX/SURF4 family)
MSTHKILENNKGESALISWFLLILNLASAFYISKTEDYSFWFLILLIVNMTLSFVFAKKINNIVLNLSRILLGILFIYSGFVKGVDPLGTQFKIEDYFYAYHMEWAVPSALILSVIMNAAEFTIGGLLILRIKTKWVIIIALLMMIGFTITTLFDALYSPVPDCGCFGDALIISNWQTFYKNLVINAFILIVFIRRLDFKEYSSKIIEYSGLAAVILGFASFEVYNINNLPIVDFRPWKLNNRLVPENPKPVQYFLTYKNTKTGEEKEYLSKELPWKDSLFMAEWKWASSREIDPNIAEMNVFPMIDEGGNDVSKEIVSDSNFVFIFVIYNLNKVPTKTVAPINEFYALASKNNYNVVLLSSDLPSDLRDFREKNKMSDIPVFNSDDTALKAAVRSNPGLIVVKSGKVIAKYHHRNFPTFEEFIKTH